MGTPTLRPAVAKDSEFAYSVKRAAFREYVQEVWGWDEAEQRQLHERRFAAQDFLIVNVDGRDVGIVAIVKSPESISLNQLFLLPEHQSKGIGRECMRLVIEEASRAGLSVRLRVLKVNPRAVAFYERLGFARVGESQTHVLMELRFAPRSE